MLENVENKDRFLYRVHQNQAYREIHSKAKPCQGVKHTLGR